MKSALFNQYKSFVKSPSSVVSFAFPIILLLIIGSFEPVAWIISPIITLSIISICLLGIGTQFFELRRTNFFKFQKTTSNKKMHFFLSVFIFAFIVSMIEVLILIFIAWFFTTPFSILCSNVNNVRFANEQISAYISSIENVNYFSTFNINLINPIALVYSVAISILLTTVVAVFFSTIFNSNQSYVFFSTIYMIIYLVVGGILIPANIINTNVFVKSISIIFPSYHTNILVDSAMGNDIGYQINSLTNYLDELSKWLSDVSKLDINVDPVNYAQEIINIQYDEINYDITDIHILTSIFPFIPLYLTEFSELTNMVVKTINSLDIGVTLQDSTANAFSIMRSIVECISVISPSVTHNLTNSVSTFLSSWSSNISAGVAKGDAFACTTFALSVHLTIFVEIILFIPISTILFKGRVN